MLVPVVKGNGYGYGHARLARESQRLGVDTIAVGVAAEVALVRVNVEYWGDASAVYASGGRVIMRDSVIEAKSWDPAVLIEGAVIDIARTKIAGEAAGVDLTPGNGESRLDTVGIIARGGETPGDVGLLVRGLRSGTGAMTIRNTVVCGWTTGLQQKTAGQMAPIKLEAGIAGLSNTKYTIAMARSTVPDSATSEFYFNSVDNSAGLDKSATSAGYAVFGRVISGQATIDKINAEPTQQWMGIETPRTEVLLYWAVVLK